ncbi:SMC family protein [Metapseudomonas boanensis]|uniref:Dynamin family protein n=1 Tax=Metapseudomonas boanensis TaxID=2822138 RepID=A0ABS5XF42_9GAMM|nr:hypothetical protein [Pseudomonas boanensis]MBT8766300.1 hypothetical protein [Pseudomonas boanensis]
MPSSSAVEYWHALQVRQPEWALRAYARLVQTLSQDVQQRLQLKDAVAEPYVVVFGKTQVGKTTLLLDLMGVAPTHMARISKVLRGGRDAGQSATATTMEYCRSASERWGLSRKGETLWLERDADMTQALGALRAQMERGQLKTEAAPCVVHIPKSCFLGGAQGPGVRMLDLPGDNPANEEEQRHVHLMAKTYLPFADLILLVGKGDDLGFLRPGAITLPGIEDWQSMPYRFRIVTTYSYFPKSVKDILRKEPDVDAAQVRQRLIEQVERFGKLSEPAREARLYFPLEFGNSWQQTQRDDPLLHSRMAPIITALRNELLEQITGSTTPMGRLRSTLDTHISVRYIQQKKTRAIEEALRALEERKAASAADVQNWAKLVESSQQRVRKLSELLAEKPVERGTAAITQAAEALLASSGARYRLKEGSVKDDRETLYALIRNYRRALGGVRLEVQQGNCPLPYWRQVRTSFEAPEQHLIDGTLDREFGPVQRILNDYWFDTYLSSSNYQEDCARVHRASVAALARLAALWQQQWLAALAGTERAFRQALQQAQAQAAMHEEETRQARARHSVIEQAILEQNAERRRIAQNSKEDLERCERFIGLLEQEYSVALDEQYAAAMAEHDASDALLRLFSCAALSQQYYEFLAFNQRAVG